MSSPEDATIHRHRVQERVHGIYHIVKHGCVMLRHLSRSRGAPARSGASEQQRLARLRLAHGLAAAGPALAQQVGVTAAQVERAQPRRHLLGLG